MRSKIQVLFFLGDFIIPPRDHNIFRHSKIFRGNISKSFFSAENVYENLETLKNLALFCDRILGYLISYHWSHFILPDKIEKSEVFFFFIQKPSRHLLAQS